MNTQDKMDLCRRLASSFRRYELQDDLVQEGMVALLESEARGNHSPDTLRMDARLAMQNFISLRQGPLSIPTTRHTRRNARAIRSGSETSVEGMDPDTYDSLKVALGASTTLLEGDEVMYEGNTESYIWVQQVEALMKDRLSEVQYKVFQMRYGPEDLTQSEVAKALDISLIYVKKIEAKISHLLFLLNGQYTL